MIKLIGLSMSQCMKDIHTGKVTPEQVEFIVTGTKFPSVDLAISPSVGYGYADWAKDESTVEVLRHMWNTGKIIQPRLYDKEPPHSGNGHWAAVLPRFYVAPYEEPIQASAFPPESIDLPAPDPRD